MQNAETIFRAYNAAENAHDLDAAGELVTADLYVEINGRQGLGSAEDDAKANAELLRCYPDYRREIVEVVADGDRAAVRWRMLGTPAPDVDLDPLDVHGCSVVHVVDGRMNRAYLFVEGSALDDVLAGSKEEEPSA